MSRRLVIIGLASLAAGAVGAVGLIALDRLGVSPGAPVGRALVGGPFELVDHNGQRVTEQTFRGQHLLVFFGFTHCPDVCPTGLQVVAGALDQLGAKADRVTPLFVTVDPERDTPAQLKMYVEAFHPRMLGLTGSAEQIAVATKAYRVYARRVADPTSSAGYTMDHSSIVYHMGPDGAYIGHFSHSSAPETIAARLAKVL